MNCFWGKILSGCFAIGLLGTASFVLARDDVPAATDLAYIRASDLPKEGRDTLSLIRKGGPFPYAKDGSIFSNRERVLPKEPRGYYHEFTVKTPRSRDRGARRIVCGGTTGKPPALGICYYTDDHYASFKKIKE